MYANPESLKIIRTRFYVVIRMRLQSIMHKRKTTVRDMIISAEYIVKYHRD